MLLSNHFVFSTQYLHLLLLLLLIITQKDNYYNDAILAMRSLYLYLPNCAFK